MISDLDISEDQLKGTGSDGKITKNDVLALESIDNNENRKYITKKMSSLRRKIASRLVAVKNETAMLTTFNEVDMTEIFKIREKYKESFKKIKVAIVGQAARNSYGEERFLSEICLLRGVIQDQPLPRMAKV